MDKARKWTDEHLAEMELHIRQIYTQAQNELTEKWDAYMRRGESRLQNLYDAYIMAPAEEKAIALQKYKDALQNYTLKNKWYQDMVDATAFRIAHVNEIALAYINGEVPEIYVQNFNQLNPDVIGLDFNWTLRDEHMVRNLIRDTIPENKLNVAKDVLWNTKKINASVLQGVLQGESIQKIAARLLPVVNSNKTSALRTARTTVTRAENRGRQDRYEEYENRGLVLHKMWIATPDGRTRDWHLSMDGQEVGIHKAFIDGHGNRLRYPGDEQAEPETVYNCRCSMESIIIGVKGKNGKTIPMKDYRSGQDSLHKRQIRAERENRNE